MLSPSDREVPSVMVPERVACEPFVVDGDEHHRPKWAYIQPHGIGAVSYTHLDVYKRQAFEPCPFIRFGGTVGSFSDEGFIGCLFKLVRGEVVQRVQTCLLYTSTVRRTVTKSPSVACLRVMKFSSFISARIISCDFGFRRRVGKCILLSGFLSFCLFSGKSGFFRPVSYTHLDVYKRQVEGPPCRYGNRVAAGPVVRVVLA